MRLRSRRTGFLLLCALLVAAGIVVWVVLRPSEKVAPDLSWTKIEKAGKLAIATDASYPPLADVTKDGQLVGFDIDVAHELCRRLDLDPDLINTDLGGMVDGLVANKFDVIISGWIPAEEHKKLLRYSYPYFEAGQVLVINKERGGPESEDALRHGKPDRQSWHVAVEQGSTAEILLRDWIQPPAQQGQPTVTPLVRPPYAIQLAMTPDEALLNVAAGRADAAIVDHLTAMQWVAKQPLLEITGKPLTDEPYVVAGRIQDQELMKHVNAALQSMIADGWLQQEQQHWFAQPPPAELRSASAS